MTDAAESPAVPPIHIEETITAIARLHAEHHANATLHQRVVERITAALSRPHFLIGLTCLIAAWMAGNEGAALLGWKPIDPAPFPGLTGAVSLASLYFVVLILTTQRRDDGLSRRRELLTLELAILSEQKIAKVIQLLEESRRDNPNILNRRDPEAETMGRAADTQSVLNAITDKPVSKPEP